VTREAEFENRPIPPEKVALRQYIMSTIARCEIATDIYFGFYNQGLPARDQRFGGFNHSRWATPQEVEFIVEERKRWHRDSMRRTRLYTNEADIALGARSLHSVVLTLDRKPGPLLDALNQGGRVLFLNEFEAQGIRLAKFVRSAYRGDGAQS